MKEIGIDEFKKILQSDKREKEGSVLLCERTETTPRLVPPPSAWKIQSTWYKYPLMYADSPHSSNPSTVGRVLHFCILLPRMNLIFSLHSNNVEPSSKHWLSSHVWLHDRGGVSTPHAPVQQQLSRSVTSEPHRAVLLYPLTRLYYIYTAYMYVSLYDVKIQSSP